MNPAQEILAARRRRTVRIRTYIAVGLVVMFAAFFGVIYVRMALGKDPGLRSTAPLRTVSRVTAAGPPVAAATRAAVTGATPAVALPGRQLWRLPGRQLWRTRRRRFLELRGSSSGSNGPSGVTTRSS